MYSSINNYDKNAEHQTEMQNKLKDEKLSFFDKATLCFAIAKSYTDQKNHKESCNYFIKGNENMFKTYKNANINNHIELFQKIKNEKNGDYALFAVTDNGYEKLALNFADIRNKIAEQRQIILSYKEYYESE